MASAAADVGRLRRLAAIERDAGSNYFIWYQRGRPRAIVVPPAITAAPTCAHEQSELDPRSAGGFYFGPEARAMNLPMRS